MQPDLDILTRILCDVPSVIAEEQNYRYAIQYKKIFLVGGLELGTAEPLGHGRG